jgi:hypothetical protein
MAADGVAYPCVKLGKTVRFGGDGSPERASREPAVCRLLDEKDAGLVSVLTLTDRRLERS